ncbi:hypothetical protein C0J52_01774 [Blattella germanica]|nr:hypothetical protein C0J52_01774 [Blattella germanica]
MMCAVSVFEDYEEFVVLEGYLLSLPCLVCFLQCQVPVVHQKQLSYFYGNGDDNILFSYFLQPVLFQDCVKWGFLFPDLLGIAQKTILYGNDALCDIHVSHHFLLVFLKSVVLD